MFTQHLPSGQQLSLQTPEVESLLLLCLCIWWCKSQLLEGIFPSDLVPSLPALDAISVLIAFITSSVARGRLPGALKAPFVGFWDPYSITLVFPTSIPTGILDLHANQADCKTMETVSKSFNMCKHSDHDQSQN